MRFFSGADTKFKWEGASHCCRPQIAHGRGTIAPPCPVVIPG